MPEMTLTADAIRGAIQRHGAAVTRALIEERAFTVTAMDADRDGFVDELALLPDLMSSLSGTQPLAGEPDTEILCVLPYNLGLWALIPLVNLLAGGNRVRLKLPRDCPASARALQVLLRELVGSDHLVFDQRPGPELLQHALHDERCRGVCLYGSEGAGQAYDGVADEAGGIVLFEGPGNNPHIVLADAPADVSEQLIVEKFAFFSGQACLAPERLLVHTSRYDQVLEELTAGMQQLVVGEAADPDVVIGPIRYRPLRDRLVSQVEDAVSQGGVVVHGGTGSGEWLPPTLIAGLTPSMRATREEIFGPVLYAAPFDDAAEAIELAGLSPYGLGATVWGWEEADAVATELKGEAYLEPVTAPAGGRFGCVDLNGTRRANSFNLPFGGYGLSGWVRVPAPDGDGSVLLQGPKHVAREFVRPQPMRKGSRV